MKFASLALLSLVSASASAATLEVVGPYSEKPVYTLQSSVQPGATVGSVTVSLLDSHKIPYHGSEGGIHSILNTPEGDKALEVINDQEMRA